MIDGHTKANDNLKNVASQKNIDLMVEDHKEDIADFKEAEGDVSNNDIKNFITTTLPTLQKNLDAIQAIKSKI